MEGKRLASSGDNSPIDQSTTVINGPVTVHAGSGGAAAPEHRGWKKTLSVTLNAGTLLALAVALVSIRAMSPSQLPGRDQEKTRSIGHQDIGPRPTPPQSPPPPQPSNELTVSFDRDAPIYHHGERQALTIRVPEAGYLYVISLWAQNEKAFLLYHPEWNKGLVWDGTAARDNPAWKMDYARYGLDNAAPQVIPQGGTLRLMETKIEFPEIFPPEVQEAKANVMVILASRPLRGIPADYKADLAPALRSMGLMPRLEGEPRRNGSPPQIHAHERSSIAHLHLASYSVLKH